MLWDFCFRVGLLEHLSKKIIQNLRATPTSWTSAPQVPRMHRQPRHDRAVESFGATLLLQACLQLRLVTFPRPKRIQERWNTPPRGDRENFCRHRPGIQRVPKKSSKSPEEILNTLYVCI